MGENTDFHDPEEAEEALSLCDLPLDDNNNNNSDNEFQDLSKDLRRAASEPAEFFEFLNNLSSEMCPAEDIIFCGKLIPFKEPSSTIQIPKPLTKYDNKEAVFRRRSESLSELQSSVTRSNSTKTKVLMRNSRSLDNRKLNRISSSKNSLEAEMERNSSIKSVGKSDMSAKKAVKPRWYVLMFGMVKFPAEMELNDIKSRQFRRNPSVMFPPLDAGKKFPVNRSSNKGPYKILKALSCKDHASVAVTASFCMPQI